MTAIPYWREFIHIGRCDWRRAEGSGYSPYAPVTASERRGLQTVVEIASLAGERLLATTYGKARSTASGDAIKQIERTQRFARFATAY